MSHSQAWKSRWWNSSAAVAAPRSAVTVTSDEMSSIVDNTMLVNVVVLNDLAQR